MKSLRSNAFCCFLSFASFTSSVLSWNFASQATVRKPYSSTYMPKFRTPTALHILETKERGETIEPSVEETTEKYGLEAGLFQSMKNEDGGESAKSLLKKYGVAYLATSIPLAIVSFAICYVLVDSGVDVAGILSKIGINSDSGDTSEKVGTFAIAYAAHKAASPIRFPPTVLLTPVVAKLIGKEAEEDSEVEEKNENKDRFI